MGLFGNKSKTSKKRPIHIKIARLITFSVLGVTGLIIASALIITTFFKKNIETGIKDQLHNNVNATAYFDANDFSLSMFSNFPNLTASMKNFGLVGKDEFQGDTLVGMGKFQVEVNLWSLFKDTIVIDGIYLHEPLVNAIITKEGKANFDIYIGETDSTVVEAEEPDAETAPFNAKINHWEIKNANVFFFDRASNTLLEIENLNHSGSGDFSNLTNMISTKTDIKSISAVFDNSEYLKKTTIHLDLTIAVEENNSKFTLKENELRINELPLVWNGYLKMNDDESYDMDISFGAKETEFKHLFSLIPQEFRADADKYLTNGAFQFSGFAKGKYSESSLPAYNMKLFVKDGTVQYPDLPASLNALNIDLAVDNKTGVLSDNLLEIKNFSFNMHKSPFRIKGMVKGIDPNNMDIDLDANSNLDLSSISQLLPELGIDMKGTIEFALNTKGNLNFEKEKYPDVSAMLKVKKGYFKSEYYPAPIENLQINSVTSIPEGDLEQGRFELEKLQFKLDGDEFITTAQVDDFVKQNFDISLNGIVDLNKIMKVFPIEGMELGGRFLIDHIKSKGNAEDILAEKYNLVETYGTVQFENFIYMDKTILPGAFTMEKGSMVLSPKKITISDLEGKISKSDYSSSGEIKNYMGYVFDTTGKEILQGNFVFNSTYFDVNEWMYEDGVPTTPAETTEEVPYEKPEYIDQIPENIDFELKSKINKIAYDYMNIDGLNTTVYIKEGKLIIPKSNFKVMGANMVADFIYDTKPRTHAKYSMNLKVDQLEFSEAFKNVVSLKSLIPIGDKIQGRLNIPNMHMDGDLDTDYMPNLNSITANGLLDIVHAEISDLTTLSKINNKAKMKNGSNNLVFKNTKLPFKIKDGKISLTKPVSAQAGNIPFNITGYSQISGDINYDLGFKVPSNQLNNLLADNGIKNSQSSIPLNVSLTGPVNDPKVSLKGMKDAMKTNATELVKGTIKNELDNQKKDLAIKKERTKKEIQDSLQAVRNQIISDAQIRVDKINQECQDAKNAEQRKIEKQAQAKIDNAKGLKKIQAKAEAEIMKKGIGAALDKISKKCQEKANAVMAKAKTKADAIK